MGRCCWDVSVPDATDVCESVASDRVISDMLDLARLTRDTDIPTTAVEWLFMKQASSVYHSSYTNAVQLGQTPMGAPHALVHTGGMWVDRDNCGPYDLPPDVPPTLECLGRVIHCCP